MTEPPAKAPPPTPSTPPALVASLAPIHNPPSALFRCLDEILGIVEVLVAIVLDLLALSAIFVSVLWVFFGTTHPDIQARLAILMRTTNENWKLALILVIPLFYRTLRRTIERVARIGKEGVTLHPSSGESDQFSNPHA